MSNKEIPLVPAAAQLDGTEQAHVVQGGNSRRSTVEDISAFGRTWFRFISRTVAAQPASPAEGDYYIIPTGATGAVWAGDDGKIACFRNGAWELTVPLEGYAGWVGDENINAFYSGTSWVASLTTEQISGFIASPSDKSYTIALKMAHGFTITEVTTQSVSGTCTATFKINSTALGGTANSVSSSEDSQTHSSSNVGAAGDNVVLTVSSNSACTDMSFTIKYTRVLA